MRGSTGSVSNPVFIIGIPVMVIIADLVTRGIHNFWWHLAAMVVVALLLYVWLMMHRFRLAYAESQLEAKGLDLALAERRAEARADGGSVPPSMTTEGAS